MGDSGKRPGLRFREEGHRLREELMGRGKLAMMISGPWAWSKLIKSGIEFWLSDVRREWKRRAPLRRGDGGLISIALVRTRI
jgi:hypothetical protein